MPWAIHTANRCTEASGGTLDVYAWLLIRAAANTTLLKLVKPTAAPHRLLTPYTWAEKFESFERINSIRETNGNFDSCNSCKRLGTSRLHELHESKFPFVSRIEFIRSKLSNFSAHVYGVIDELKPLHLAEARLNAGDDTEETSHNICLYLCEDFSSYCHGKVA